MPTFHPWVEMVSNMSNIHPWAHAPWSGSQIARPGMENARKGQRVFLRVAHYRTLPLCIRIAVVFDPLCSKHFLCHCFRIIPILNILIFTSIAVSIHWCAQYVLPHRPYHTFHCSCWRHVHVVCIFTNVDRIL